MKVRAIIGVAALVLAAVLTMGGVTPTPAAEPYVIGGIFSITGPASYLGDPENKTMELLAAEVTPRGALKGIP